MILNYFKNLFKNNFRFIKNTSTVLFSSIFVQLIPVLILPVITRTISEELVGIYLSWISISATITILMTMKFDVAIFVASKKSQARNLTKSIFYSSLLIGFLIYILSLFVFNFDFVQEKIGDIERFVNLLILNSVFVSIFTGLNSFQIYCSDFKAYNISRIIQALIINVLVISTIILLSKDVFFIILAHTIGSLFSLISIVIMTKFKISFEKKEIFENLKFNFNKFKRFPIYSLPAEFINNLSLNIPYIFILSRFDPIFLGYYTIINKALSAPIGLVGSSMLTVFKEEASIEIRKEKKCNKSYLRILKFLLIVGLPSFVIFYFVAPDLFSIVFSEKYRVAGEIAKIMIPLFLFKFIVSPLSYTLFLMNRQHIDLLWQIVLSAGIVIIFLFSSDFYIAIKGYVVFYSAMYIINFFITKKLANKKA